MRKILAMCFAAASIPAVAAAQLSTTPGYTAFDQQQQAKLRALVGTWTCVDTPASKKPDIVTTKQEGNFFVTHETGDSPNTEYTRWSHGYKMFYTVQMSDQGSTTISTTKALDPNNASWATVFPARDPNGKTLFPYVVTLNGSTTTTKGQFYDDKGKLMNFSSVCTKH
jgi:hypothetical protein